MIDEDAEAAEAVFRDIRCSMRVMNICDENRAWIVSRMRPLVDEIAGLRAEIDTLRREIQRRDEIIAASAADLST